MSNIPYSVTTQAISFVFAGKPYNVAASQPNFAQVKAAVIAGDDVAVQDLIDKKTKVTVAARGRVSIVGNTVLFDQEAVPLHLAERILEHLSTGNPVEPLIHFTEKLMVNPEKKSGIISDLFKWLEVGKTPICPDGDFLAYKKVRENYKSHHDGQTDNSIGKIVKQRREDCNPNRNETCSRGLHFCSFDYLRHFGGSDGRIVILKINPENVVAIPTDYNETKGRACEYEVIGEVEHDVAQKVFNHQVVEAFGIYNENAPDEAPQRVNQTFTSPSTGREYTNDEVLSVVKENRGFTEAADYFEVSVSTIRRWVKKAEAAAVIENQDKYFETSTGARASYADVKAALNDTSRTMQDKADSFGVSRSTLRRWFDKL